jgi:hypothetical protein
MHKRAQFFIASIMLKSAERQPVNPTVAGLMSLLPLGAAVHGTVAGHSPREGLREETGSIVGGIPGTIAGGAIGAGIMGSQQHDKELNRGLGIREGILERAKVLAPDEAGRINVESLAAAHLRGILGGVEGTVRGAGRGALIGGALTGALGTAIAARGGNRVTRISNSPLLAKVQAWLNQQSQKSAMTKRALNAWEQRLIDGKLSVGAMQRLTGLAPQAIMSKMHRYGADLRRGDGAFGRDVDTLTSTNSGKKFDLLHLGTHQNFWSGMRNLVRSPQVQATPGDEFV